jgi:Flp pilus assembly pilin Flp
MERLRAIRDTLAHEGGQSLAEYVLVILLIAIAVVAALGAFGGGLQSLFQTILRSTGF